MCVYVDSQLHPQLNQIQTSPYPPRPLPLSFGQLTPKVTKVQIPHPHPPKKNSVDQSSDPPVPTPYPLSHDTRIHNHLPNFEYRLTTCS